ncbi:MAG TPA: LuxR family transcriptional regulator [Cytophagales bacterium]|nr:LuxR family transcriptional regulator [Cytophagales bacterium]
MVRNGFCENKEWFWWVDKLPKAVQQVANYCILDALVDHTMRTNVLRTVFCWFLLLPFGVVVAQELPPVQNFTPLDYKGGNQNWGMDQTPEKLMYVANNLGLLEFNGAAWTLYPSPNETIVRSVRVIEDKIFTGCYREFGYWQPGVEGVLSYTSLSAQLKEPLLEDEEFWNIVGIGDNIIFQSLSRIYIYNQSGGSFNIIESDETIVKMFEVDDRIYFQRINQGVFVIEDGRTRLLLADGIFQTDELVNIFASGDGITLLTRNNGFFQYRQGEVEPLEDVNSLLAGYTVYSALQLEEGSFALGTISNGMIFLNQNMEWEYQINQNNGLTNNTVLAIFEDQDNNLWLGLDYGVSYINQFSPFKEFEDQVGVIGSVYAAAIHDGNLYLGTNQGLFFKPMEGVDAFMMIPGTKGQVWSLKVLRGELFGGHHNGTLIIRGNRAIPVGGPQGTWDIKALEGTDYLLQGNYDGLYVLEPAADGWVIRNKLSGFQNSSRHFEMGEGKVFVNHEYKGVFTLAVDDAFTQVEQVSIDTLLKGTNSSLAKYKGEVLYACKNGVYTYQDEQSAFVRNSTLSTIYTEADYVSGKMALVNDDSKFWMFSREEIVLVTSSITAEPSLKRVPISLNVRKDVIEYETIIDMGRNGDYILGTSSGYIVLDVSEIEVADFQVNLSKISKGINQYHSATQNLIDKSVAGDFTHQENNFRIHFYTPEYYKFFTPTYQYQLSGFYDVWSDWTTESSVFFENLPPGDYTFNVRSQIGGKLSENIATYSFSIAPPWYFSTLMIAVYVVLFIAISFGIHSLYRKYYRNQQQKLILANQRELELTKIQSEKELIRVKNEQLQKEFKDKSKELAASTLNLVKKNELLREIKEQLIHAENQKNLAPVVSIIDENLNEQGNWEMFKEAFDNADTEFFKKLNELHPNLSPNDLKLCAYLRLNLSSKEIAPLLNISPRSVEIKRYRLRKKLNLTNDDNLTNYIINI